MKKLARKQKKSDLLTAVQSKRSAAGATLAALFIGRSPLHGARSGPSLGGNGEAA